MIPEHEGFISNCEAQIELHRAHLHELELKLEGVRRHIAHCADNGRSMDVSTHRHHEHQLAGEVQRFNALITQALRNIELHRAHVEVLRRHDAVVRR